MRRIDRNGLNVDQRLADFVETQALPGTGVAPAGFWAGFAQAVAEFGPRNRALLATREAMQGQIDDWHRANPKADAAMAVLLPGGPTPNRLRREAHFVQCNVIVCI